MSEDRFVGMLLQFCSVIFDSIVGGTFQLCNREAGQ